MGGDRSEQTPRRPSRMPYIAGLDGLRALAVIAVVLFHADTSIRGGYLGVETFFVLSGFLITALLVGELQGTGRIDVRAFWIRRARRLLPALFAVLGATLVYALLFLPREVQSLGRDTLASLAYVMNWRLIAEGGSYFDPSVRPSLVQHLWSLAIEEQFYVVWPVLFIVGMRFLRTRGLAVVVIAGALVSAGLMAMLYQPGADPSRLYYGTDTRAAGLLVGVTLALLWRPRTAQDTPRRGGPWVDVAGLTALGGLLASYVYLYDAHPSLYRGGFLVIAVLTALVIVALTHGSTRIMPALLSWAPLRWIGTRSYAIYLWHWPVFMVTRPYLDVNLDGITLLALRLIVVGMLAELSYRLIEQPVLRGGLGRVWQRATGDGITTLWSKRRWRRYPVFAMVLLFSATCSSATMPPPVPTVAGVTPQATTTTAATEAPTATDGATATTEATEAPTSTDAPTATTEATEAPTVTDAATATTEATTEAPTEPTTETTTTAEATSEATVEPTEPAAAAFDPALASQLQALLDATTADRYIPGASLAVYIDGQEPWLGTSGTLDRAGQALAVDTRMRIASISKTFTAVVILQLADEGKLGLDTTLATYLPNLVPDGDRITIRMLLNHSSGLYDYLEDRQFRNAAYADPTRVWEPRELVAYANRFPLSFPPGAPDSFDYSSTNYVILGMVAEQVTGRSLAEEMRARIFEPLSLDATYFQPQEAIEGVASRGYAGDADQSGVSMSFGYATANIVSTPENLIRFGQALQAGELLSAAMMTEMNTFISGQGQYNMPTLEYGLGVMRNQFTVGPNADGQERSAATRTMVGHIGGFAGFRSAMWTTPDGTITIALGLNQSDAEPNVLAASVFDAVLTSLGR